MNVSPSSIVKCLFQHNLNSCQNKIQMIFGIGICLYLFKSNVYLLSKQSMLYQSGFCKSRIFNQWKLSHLTWNIMSVLVLSIILFIGEYKIHIFFAFNFNGLIVQLSTYEVIRLIIPDTMIWQLITLRYLRVELATIVWVENILSEHCYM